MPLLSHVVNTCPSLSGVQPVWHLFFGRRRCWQLHGRAIWRADDVKPHVLHLHPPSDPDRQCLRRLVTAAAAAARQQRAAACSCPSMNSTCPSPSPPQQRLAASSSGYYRPTGSSACIKVPPGGIVVITPQGTVQLTCDYQRGYYLGRSGRVCLQARAMSSCAAANSPLCRLGAPPLPTHPRRRE